MRPVLWLLLAPCAFGCAEKDYRLRIERARPGYVDTLEARQATELVTKRHLSNLRMCALRGLQQDSQIPRGTRMEVVFGITPEGRALDVEIGTPLFKETTFGQCVVRILLFLRFPTAVLGSRQVHLQLALDAANPILGATVDTSSF